VQSSSAIRIALLLRARHLLLLLLLLLLLGVPARLLKGLARSSQLSVFVLLHQ
jgi:hypothetical protein